MSAADFDRVTSGLTSWSQWCAAWVAVASEHEQLGRAALATGRNRSAGEHLARASVYYHFAEFVFVADLAQMRAAHASAVRCLTDALPCLDPPGRRVEIPFERTRLPGVLRLPTGPGPHPTVILLSGLDSTKEELRSTEDTFLARGMATFSVDGPGQGEVAFDLPIRGDWSGPATAIVDALSSCPDVNESRLALWGVSLGGYYSARSAAALGTRVRACVALSGPFCFGDGWDQLPALTRETFQVRSGARDAEQARHLADTLDLSAVAGQITCPVLVVFGRRDRLIHWHQAQRLVTSVGERAELLMLEQGNHGCANVAPWHRPYTADWLAARLGVTSVL